MPDLAALLALEMSWVELVVRGTAVYWFLFCVFRFVLRRDVGSLAIADVLLLVLIADAAQNAMAGGYQTITEGFILIATIVAWNYAMDWVSFRVPTLRKWLSPPPLKLVDHGALLRKNMRRELLTIDELQSKMREEGVKDLSEVKAAFMESDGRITFVKF